MGLDDKLRSKTLQLMHQQSDTALTADELRRKYAEQDESPPQSPRRASTTHRRDFTPSSFITATRCWACATALRDPGASFFACGACGALNGEELKPPKLDSGPCKRAARCGRLAGVLTFVILVSLGVGAWRVLSPRVGPLFAYLCFGVMFNLFLTCLLGPGYVTTEICPLKSGGGSGSSGKLDVEGGGLSALKGEKGDMPLRGWRRCTETGLSMPPRSHYCRMSRKVVLRMEYFCPLLNTCIGHRNHHYYLRGLAFLAAASARVLASCLTCARDPRQTSSHPAAAGPTMLQLFGSANATWVDTFEEVEEVVLDESGYLLLGGSLILCVVSMSLLSQQLRNVIRGLTHIESLRTPPPHDYDLGPAANLRGTFVGGAPLLIAHLLPIPLPAVGDGIHFACRPPPRRV